LISPLLFITSLFLSISKFITHIIFISHLTELQNFMNSFLTSLKSLNILFVIYDISHKTQI